MKRFIFFVILFCLFGLNRACAQSAPSVSEDDPSPVETIFDDKLLLDGYAEKYQDYDLETLLAMIRDDTLTSPYKMAAAVRVFKEKYSLTVFSREKILITKSLLRRLARTNSAFVQIEILHTLCQMDRYKYFKTTLPALIQKLDHYNSTVNELAYTYINKIIMDGNSKGREASIVFNTMRKVLFLSRRRLENVTTPDDRLKQKLKILRWSIKILGTQELRRLPKEVIRLL